ncbi:PA2817 family protein [Marinomonas algicola]|uniref:PA2817 family protein n=1 Tax=Marinomonas algicola TaxID=2773454 RepID=UPI00174D0CCC|nr:PA2817 family protein [Marinomonas algicola]
MNLRTQYILDSFTELKQRMFEHLPFDQTPLAEEEEDFLQKWDDLMEEIKSLSHDYLFTAQELLARLIRCYPNLTALIKRELLWFVGGECLHFLGDEELALYQKFEETAYEYEQNGQDYDIASLISELRNKETPNTITH